MNSPVDSFLRVLQHELSWTTANRQLRLRLSRNGEKLPLLLQRLTGTEAICGGIDYHLGCVASSGLKLPLKDLIALPVEIQIVTDSGQLRSVCGIVTEARAGDFDGGLAVYHLVVRDAMAIMEKRTNSRIFRFQNELDIVQVLLDEWRRSNAVFAGAFEYEFDPLLDRQNFPPREQIMQYNESDADFVRRLLKRRGVSWYVRPGRCRHSPADPRDRTPAHTLVFFNRTASLPQSAAGTVRYHRANATDPRDVITSWVGARTLQPGSSTRHSWDYKNPQGEHFMTVNVRGRADQGAHGNSVAASLDDYIIETAHVGNDMEDHLRLGQLVMDRHDLETKCFHAEGNLRNVGAGEYFELDGHPEVDEHPADEREFVITELQVTARNNLPKDLDAQGARLVARGCAPQDHDEDDTVGLVKIRFKAVRRGVPIVPAFDPRTDLPHPQLQSAIVVGPPNEEVHCDALGRVKIRFPGMRAEDHKHAHGAGASDSPADSAWVRVASNWAGNGPGSQNQCGTLTLPRVGSEVMVAFVGGDPDRPIIMCQAFNQDGVPPALSSLGGLPGNRYQSGTRSHEVGGQRGNQMRFDDTHGQISAQLASDHANSELNLGWMTKPRANGAGEPRGEGAELRSNDAVAIRGAKGVFLTAEASSNAEGQQLDRAGMVGFAQVLQDIVDELTRLAEHHAGDEVTAPIMGLVNKLKCWDHGSNVAAGAGGGAPIVAVSAPAGIVLASPEHVVVGGGKKVSVASAGGDTEISAARSLFMRAARGLSMFAFELGMKLVAGRGNVLVQTHQGDIQLRSSGRIRLIAAEGIDLQAPEVRVVSQGAQTDWKEGTITQQSTGPYVVKSSQFQRVGPGGGAPVGLNLPSTKMATDERLVLRHWQTRKALPNRRYIAHLEDGRTIEGVSDEQGRTSLARSDAMGQVRFELLPRDPSST